MTTKMEAAEIAMNCGGVAADCERREVGYAGRALAGEQQWARCSLRRPHAWKAAVAGIRGWRPRASGGGCGSANGQLPRARRSLLNSGVVRVEREFSPMDVVSIRDRERTELRVELRRVRKPKGETRKERKRRPGAVHRAKTLWSGSKAGRRHEPDRRRTKATRKCGAVECGEPARRRASGFSASWQCAGGTRNAALQLAGAERLEER